ncbi:MAG: PucR family transcriptional regulator ligand-binding domain-containing protein, partial [Intrasporangium sp.]|uniref:PucR family transcriptional regulator ligand-binding domain-containing protein n=1 Tax=Intrasporangium sp. TaxID=1925024 RepID=UPI003F7FB4A7
MLPTLDEVLALPAFVAADHEVLVGRAGDVVVRWVHSSEVYEMGGLLAGGELLLTTGLGLEGRSEDQIARYVDRIADSGCAAVAFEVGRSFLEIPPVMVRIARERGLGLVVLREVVPFHRMVEEFHELLVRRKVGAPRGSEPAWQELIGLVAAGQGIQTLLNATARLAGCPVGVVDLDGRGLHRSAEVGLPPRPTASFHVE